MAQALTCIESEELLALAGLGVLARGESHRLDQHLRGCAMCRRATARYRQATSMLPNGLDPVEPPAALRRSLMHAVYLGTRPSPEPRRAGRRWSRPRWRAFSLGGAALAVAAVAATLVAVVHPAGSAMRTYTVYGTTSAPAVRGTLTYDTQAEQAVMSVSGLPALVSVAGAAPQVYEVWLVGANGAAHGVAFLERSPTSASWSTVIHADLTQFVAVAATTEPAGGSAEPTGSQLLNVQVTRS